MDKPDQQFYAIGTVSKMTGVEANTIRAWERRYAAVTPQRDANGIRRFSKADILRVRVLNALIRRGESIGRIAHEPDEQLQIRMDEYRHGLGAELPTAAKHTAPPLEQVFLVGPGLAKIFAEQPKHDSAVAVHSYHHALAGLADAYDLTDRTAVVYAVKTVSASVIQQLNQFVEQNSVHALVLVYAYATRMDLNAIRMAGIRLLHNPSSAQAILHSCRQVLPTPTPSGIGLVAAESDYPLIQFNAKQLLALRRVRTVINCECPTHIAELLMRLNKLERDTQMCEDTAEDDVAMHVMLRRAVGQSRLILEQALADVLALEKISLPA